MNDARGLFVAAGFLTAVASLLHLACIVGGPDWYRFFGAGEQMARAAERGSLRPALVTAAIATILAIWAAYAFSAAGQLPRLPLLRIALFLIAAVFLARGALIVAPGLWRPDLTPAFKLWSSLICLVLGGLYATGTWRAWAELAR